MIKIILWDVDGTLLDFHAAEAAAVIANMQDRIHAASAARTTVFFIVTAPFRRFEHRIFAHSMVS